MHPGCKHLIKRLGLDARGLGQERRMFIEVRLAGQDIRVLHVCEDGDLRLENRLAKGYVTDRRGRTWCTS